MSKHRNLWLVTPYMLWSQPQVSNSCAKDKTVWQLMQPGKSNETYYNQQTPLASTLRVAWRCKRWVIAAIWVCMALLSAIWCLHVIMTRMGLRLSFLLWDSILVLTKPRRFSFYLKYFAPLSSAIHVPSTWSLCFQIAFHNNPGDFDFGITSHFFLPSGLFQPILIKGTIAYVVRGSVKNVIWHNAQEQVS